MNTINVQTKIGAILKEKPEALEAIVSISPHFNKLRNPLLRKFIASRTTIKMASQVGGCSVEDFFDKLRPLGFVVDASDITPNASVSSASPSLTAELKNLKMVELDVRSLIESGKDPFNIIMGKIKQLTPDQMLKLINSFEPVPLIELLAKKGFEYQVEHFDENYVVTYFHKKEGNTIEVEPPLATENSDWDDLLHYFKEKTQPIDVRQMEMPLPMHTILEALDNLPDDYLLFVHHKRVPVFLLPELKERKFDYRIREISDNEVHLLIFKSQL